MARWSSRIALFSASLLLVGLVLHRLTSFPTAVAIIVRRRLCGAASALLVGLVALVQIWRNGYAGAASAAIGILLPLLMAGWPLAFCRAYRNLPHINDVTHRLRGATPLRGARQAAHGRRQSRPAYPGARFAEQQKEPIPTCVPCVERRSRRPSSWSRRRCANSMEGRCRRAAGRKAGQERHARGHRPDHVIGFTDDIVVRVEGSANRSRIDVRSASRYGRSISARTRLACAAFSRRCRRAPMRPPPASPAVAAAQLRTTRHRRHGQDGRKSAIRRKREVAVNETALNQVLNVREHRKRRRVEKLGVRGRL